MSAFVLTRSKGRETQLSGDPVTGPVLLLRKLSFGAAVRAEVWQLLADMVESGLELEEALRTLIKGYLRTNRRGRAGVLAEMVSAGLDGKMAERLAPYTMSPEQLILDGLGRQEARAVFASAARLLRNQLALRKALTEAIAMPILLFFSLFALMLFFGLELLPALEEVVDFESLPLVQDITVSVTLALSDNPARLGVWIAGGIAGLVMLMRVWTGPGRVLADRVPPFSVMRLHAGTGFLFALVEYGRNGTTINADLLERMASVSGRYAASRIRALIPHVQTNDNIGDAALTAEQGFPDDEFAVVMSALWNRRDGIEGAGQFLERRLVQIESNVKARMAVLNAGLLILVTVVLVLLMSIMFSVFETLDRTGVM